MWRNVKDVVEFLKPPILDSVTILLFIRVFMLNGIFNPKSTTLQGVHVIA